jgi:hypothetical protein
MGVENGQDFLSVRLQRQIERASYIQNLMSKSFMNRHQISKISGLSHSHVKGLEDGVIENPKRSSLVHLGVAMNLGLIEIDGLLEFFGQPKLTYEDSSSFIEAAKRRELTKTLQPLYGKNINLELLLLSMETIKGDLVVFNDKLPLPLRSIGHSSFQYGFTDNSIYSYIVEQAHKARIVAFIDNLNYFKFSHYITTSFLKRYIKSASNIDYKNYIIDHILNLIDMLCHDNFNFTILNAGPLFRFVLKYPASENITKKLFFVGHALYDDEDHNEYRKTWLRGYATDDENLVKQFDREYKKFLPLADDQYTDREKIKEFLLKSMSEYGNVSEKELNEKIKTREKFPHNILQSS